MGKTKAPVKPAKKDLLDDVSLDISAELDLDTIQLKGGRWLVRLAIEAILPRAYHIYKLTLELNEEPHLQRIDDLEKSLDDTLFKDDRAERKQIEDKVRAKRKELETLRKDCETFEFTGTVQEIKYRDDGTSVLFRVPDDVIEPFNRQKHRMNLYHVVLSPIGV